MKNIFISVPMSRRTDENIRASIDRMHKMVEAVLEEECRVITGYDPDAVTETTGDRVKLLSKSIMLMGEADLAVFVADAHRFNGCMIERAVAQAYGIDCIDLCRADIICPDLKVWDYDKWEIVKNEQC